MSHCQSCRYAACDCACSECETDQANDKAEIERLVTVVRAERLRAGLLETALRTLVDAHEAVKPALELARSALADTD